MKKLKQTIILMAVSIIVIGLAGCGTSKYTVITDIEDTKYFGKWMYFDANFEGKIGKISNLEPVLNDCFEQGTSAISNEEASSLRDIEVFGTDYYIFIDFNRTEHDKGPFYSGYVARNGIELTKETKELMDLLRKLNEEIGTI